MKKEMVPPTPRPAADPVPDGLLLTDAVRVRLARIEDLLTEFVTLAGEAEGVADQAKDVLVRAFDQGTEDYHKTIRELREENRRLRDALELAPQVHAPECSMRVGDGYESCTCWVKAARAALDRRPGG